jgi:hypothetical protein
MVAGGGFEPPTFGLCDLTHLSMRVGLYLHSRGVLAIQSLRLPPVSGAWFGIALSLARRKAASDPRELLEQESEELNLSPQFRSLLEKFVPKTANHSATEPLSAA